MSGPTGRVGVNGVCGGADGCQLTYATNQQLAVVYIARLSLYNTIVVVSNQQSLSSKIESVCH